MINCAFALANAQFFAGQMDKTPTVMYNGPIKTAGNPERMKKMNKDYLKNLYALLQNLENTQEEAIDQVAEACAGCIEKGGLLYFFGTGHSHMICEEPFYRAGGLACVYPILETDLMLHEGAAKSSGYERLPGLGNLVVGNTPLGEGDVLFITSMKHTTKASSRHLGGLNLYQVCDYVLDNGAEEGDASVLLPGLDQKIAPTSSVTDITLVHLILVNTVELLLKKGITPPLFLSANTDAGDKANKAVLKEYKARVPSL